MGLHKLPAIALVLQNVDKKSDLGYVYLRVKVPGKKQPGKSPYVLKSLNLRVPSKHWDEENEIATKGYPESERVNRLAGNEKKKLKDTFDKDFEVGAIFTEQHIRNRVYPQTSNKDFLELFKEHLDFIKATWSASYHRAYEQGFEAFKSYLQPMCGNALPYHAINGELLENYQKSLTDLKRNTVFLRLRYVKEVIEKAIDKKLMTKEQLEGYKWPTYKAPTKPYLTLEQTEKIANNIYSGKFDSDESTKIVACYFLVEAYSGIRISDWGNFTIEKLVYEKSFKVGAATKNAEPIYLPFSEFPRLERIVNYILDNGLVFGLAHATVNRLLKTIMLVCDIPVSVTTHTGRRTCATLLAELGWDSRHIAEVLAISEVTVKTYIKTTRQGIKNASRRHGGL